MSLSRSSAFRTGAIALLAYALAYAAALFLLAREPGFSVAEPLFVLGVLGVAFPLLALALTRKAGPEPADPIARPGAELTAVVVYLAAYALIVLGPLMGWVRESAAAGPQREIAVLLFKLLTMVALPVAILVAFGHRPRNLLAPRLGLRRHALPLLGMGLALLAFQAVFGRGLRTLGELDPAMTTLLWAVPACFVWMSIEAGLCEEFLFRRFLQGRLSAFLRSEIAAVCAASLLFGLAHAPGLYLRGAHAMEGLTGPPSIAWAVAYSVAVISPAGLLFGTLWARTHSLGLVVVLHGLTDLLPNLAPFIRDWS